MKTIREIAEEIGVSKQAVQQKLKKEPLASSCRQHTTTNGNTKYINNQGIELIKKAFSTSVAGNQTTTNGNGIIEFFKEQLREKDRQLAEKDKHIADLTETIKIQAQSINADRHNELAGTLQGQLAGTTESGEAPAVRADEGEHTKTNPEKDSSKAVSKKWGFFGIFRGKADNI